MANSGKKHGRWSQLRWKFSYLLEGDGYSSYQYQLYPPRNETIIHDYHNDRGHQTTRFGGKQTIQTGVIFRDFPKNNALFGWEYNDLLDYSPPNCPISRLLSTYQFVFAFWTNIECFGEKKLLAKIGNKRQVKSASYPVEIQKFPGPWITNSQIDTTYGKCGITDSSNTYPYTFLCLTGD